MTRYEIELEEVVLRGLPAGYADGFGPLVERRLAALVTEGTPAGQPGQPGRAAVAVDSPGALADLVAHRVWSGIQADREGGGR